MIAESGYLLVVWITCAFFQPRVINAQTIAGVVTLSDGSTPVASAIVVAKRSFGTPVQTLTSPSGKFSLQLPQFGNWQINVLRIGFTPTAVTSVNVASEQVIHLQLIAESKPVLLQTVGTRASTACRVRPDTGLLVARVWEEARKAMLSVILRFEANDLTAEWLEYRRATDSTGRLVIEQEVSVERHATQHVFRSISGDALAHDGYITSNRDGITFYAPDPEVLLSEAFSLGHCFSLVTSPADGTMLGVSFQPTKIVRNFYDIEGVVWIDAKTSHLQSIDFTYTNLPSSAPLSVISGG